MQTLWALRVATSSRLVDFGECASRAKFAWQLASLEADGIRTHIASNRLWQNN